jgi:hypothetical protein
MNEGSELLKKWLGGAVVLLVVVGLTALVLGRSVAKQRESLIRHETALPSGLFTDPAFKLSTEQKQRIRSLEADYHAKMREYCARHCAARARIGELIRAGNPSEAELRKLAQAVGDAYTASEQATVHQVMEVGKVLTPEQRSLFLTKIAGQISAICPKEYMQ